MSPAERKYYEKKLSQEVKFYWVALGGMVVFGILGAGILFYDPASAAMNFGVVLLFGMLRSSSKELCKFYHQKINEYQQPG